MCPQLLACGWAGAAIGIDERRGTQGFAARASHGPSAPTPAVDLVHGQHQLPTHNTCRLATELVLSTENSQTTFDTQAQAAGGR